MMRDPARQDVLDWAKQALARRPVVLTLLACVLLIYSGWIAFQFMRNQLFDFNLYYLAAYGLRTDQDVYALTREYLTGNNSGWEALAAQTGVQDYAPPYRYPPLTAQMVLPLTWLPYREAGIVWLAFSAVAFVASAYLLGRLSSKPYGIGLAFLLLLLFIPSLTTLHAGQVNAFVLLALVLAVWGLQKRNHWLAGIGVAFGAMLKLVPIVLVAYFFVRRLWAATAVAIGMIVLLLLSSYVTFPPATVPSYLASFFAVGQPGTLFSEPPNQSINGVLGRFLGQLLSSTDIYRLALLGALLVVSITTWYLRPIQKLPPRWRFEFGVVICAVTLITPYTWYHQLVLVFVPLFFVLEHLLESKRGWPLAFLAILVILADIHGVTWHRFAAVPWLTSFPSLLVIVLWIMQMRIRVEVTP